MAAIEKAEKGGTTPVRPSEWGEVMDRWFAGWPWPRLWPDLRRTFAEGMDLLPVEEFTEGNEVVIRAEMPGIDPDKDVEITVSDHTLRLRAERRQETKREEKGTYRTEFQYGSFSRTIPLPDAATNQDVKATYKDGILEVRVPVDRREAKKVPIERA